MANLKKSSFLSAGESLLKHVPETDKRELNNRKITRYKVIGFVYFLLTRKKMKYPIKVVFSSLKPKRKKKFLWGLAWPWCRTITLYRHSVWVFLHELAHIYAPVNEAHGKKFAIHLERVYNYWRQYEEETCAIKRKTSRNRSSKVTR